jgi:hypothetical protein
MTVAERFLSMPSHYRSSRRPAPLPWGKVGAALGALVSLALAFFYRHEVAALGEPQAFPLDDAWIHAQYGLNLAQGHPFQYVPGTFSSGSTSPLWSLLVGLGLLLVDNAVWVGQVAGVACTVAVMVLVVVLGRQLQLRGPLLVAAPILVAAQWRMTWAALSGMEIPLFAALLLLTLSVHLRERTHGTPWRTGMLVGVLFWTRPEGLVLGALVFVDHLWLALMPKKRTGQQKDEVDAGKETARQRNRRAPLVLLAAGAAVAGPLMCSNAIVGPGIFPQTLYAKSNDIPWDSAWSLLGDYIVQLTDNHPAWLLFVIGAAGYGGLRLLGQADRSPQQFLPVLFVVAFLAGMAFFRGSPGHHSRYLIPLIPFLVLIGLQGLQALAQDLGRGATTATALALLLVATTVPLLLRHSQVYALNVASVSGHVVTMGQWLNSHVPPGAILAMSDIGAMAYFTENPIVDMRGLVSSYHGWDRLAEVDRQRRKNVDYAILFPEHNERVILRGGYLPLFALTLQRNNISATPNLVLYRPPWTDKRELVPTGRAFDFEEGQYNDWVRTGVFAQQGPVEQAGPGQAPIINLGGGRWLVSSWGPRGDQDRGHAISPAFRLEGDVMSFRLGGGQRPGAVGLRLWVDGRIERTAVGGNSEVLLHREWDIAHLRGQWARIELFDDAEDEWGHIMLDDVRQYRQQGDRPAPHLKDFPLAGPQEPTANRRAAEARGLSLDEQSPSVIER